MLNGSRWKTVIALIQFFVSFSRTLGKPCSSDFCVPRTVRKIGFGSCSKQWKDPTMWRVALDASPDVFILTGDAFYTGKKQYDRSERDHFEHRSIEELQHAMLKAKSSNAMRELNNSLVYPIIGVYDDHDRGVNDGGGGGGIHSEGVVDREERKQLFLDFLGAGTNDPRRSREGLYASFELGELEEQVVKIIVLDTRFSRAPHVIPSVGSFKGLAVFAALSRLLSTLSGLVSLQTGNMLGESQWEWLETQLQSSVQDGINVNVIVSSVQVFTTNPMVESWGHFPLERRRLLGLLQKYEPRGLVVLSGDVHVGEAIALDPDLDPVEFTSSGLTHDCSDGFIPKAFCKATFGLFSDHWPGPSSSSFLPEKNVGMLDLEWRSNHTPGMCSFDSLTVSVLNENGEPRLSFKRHSCGVKGLVLPEDENFEPRWPCSSATCRTFWVASLFTSVVAALALIARTFAPLFRTRSVTQKPKLE